VACIPADKLARVHSLMLGINRERTGMLGLWSLAALACALGLAAPPPAHAGVGASCGSLTTCESVAQQALELVRVISTVALAVTLILGPGIVLRARHSRCRLELGFLPLPGLALLVVTGGMAWALAGEVAPRVVCSLVLIPALGWLLAGALRAGPDEMLEAEERRALLVVGCVLGLVVTRTLWSLGPTGELYGGSVSRTLEAGDRPDSRISFIVVQLVAHGASPFNSLDASYFFPFNFSSRGPLSGIASAPVVLLAGGSPPRSLPNQPWVPFDPQGFMAYRLAMMAFACTAFLSLWTLTRRLGGERAAHLALLLAATTPFLVHEVWFTWPKLFAASLVLLAGLSVIGGRPLLAGLLAGIGYLVHPVALLSLPVLGGLALWPLVGAHLRRPRLMPALMLLAGVALCLVAWRLVNGSHYTQSDFLDYFKRAGLDLHPAPWTWLSYRLQSVGNTLVPLEVFLFYAHNPSINVFGGVSPGVIHFFFQYWTTLPFGIGVIFYPLLLLSVWRAGRLWRWPFFIAIVVPFAGFAIYWGASITGMLREGLQAWTLTLLAVVALQQRHDGFPWLRSHPIRAILALRSAEVFAVATVPTLVTGHRVLDGGFALTDSLALLAMVGFCACLGWMVWFGIPTRLDEEGRSNGR
jgi:hypothetical protein